jgi:predicted ribosome quality control (RQC) complex YloA/Tae2 family protein
MTAVPKTLTSFDVAAVVFELRERVTGAHIQNIYQHRQTFALKLRKPGHPTLTLLMEPGRSLHLTSYAFEKPATPPAFCMLLRRHLRNGVLVEIAQHEFERIAVFTIQTKEGAKMLVLELFGEGNLILLDSQGIVQHALRYKRMRDRNILRGERFQQAPSSGKNPFHLELKDLADLKRYTDLEVVRALTKVIGIGGTYAEEALLRARIDKSRRCESLGNDEMERILRAVQELVQPLERGEFTPCTVLDERRRAVDVVPLSLRRYDGLECQRFNSVNEALDEFYTQSRAEQETGIAAGEFEEEAARQRRILDGQQESLEKAREDAENMHRIGDAIYANFHHLQALTQRIMSERRNGKTWQEISAAIDMEKKRGEIPAVFFQSIDGKTLALKLAIDDLPFSLLLRDSVQENATVYYERAKKAKKKADGAEKAIHETLTSMDAVEQQKKTALEKVAKPVKKRRKTWYERFRWFHTSDGLLVVGGKDAVSNEILIKKHTAPHDLVFHADIEGAPFVIVKTEENPPSQQSINEAAQLAAAHSRAWKAHFSAIDVYWVYPDQVTKSPPSGESLSKGAFMIKGKKNYVRKTPLRLAIGTSTKTTPLALIGGPKDAVRNETDVYVEIAPGDYSSRELAGKIKQTLSRNASGELREAIAKISLEQIQALIPFGKGSIVSQ